MARRWIDRRWALWLYLAINVPLVVGVILTPEVLTSAFRSAIAALALVALVVGVRWQRPAVPAAWWLLVAGMVVSVAATWTRAVMLFTAGGAGRAADWYPPELFAVSFLLFIAGLALLARLSGRAYMTDALDALMVTLAMFLLLYWLVIGTMLPPSTVGLLVAVVYPLEALLLFAMAVRVALSVGVPTVALGLVVLSMFARVGSIVSLLVPALTTGSVQGTALTPYLQTASSILLGAAALHPSLAATRARTERRLDPVSRMRVLLFALLAVVALVALVAEVRHVAGVEPTDVTVSLGAALLLLVVLVARLGLTAGVAQRRAAELARRSADLASAVKEQEVLQQQLRHQAMHDPLTGLPNRVVLYERMEWVLNRSTGSRRHVLAVVDLDRLKDVNDTLGHLVGDAVMVEVTHRLLAVTPRQGMLVRLAGDDFAVLLEDTRPEEARAWADRVQAELRKPYRIGDHEVFVTSSIGMFLTEAAQPVPTAAQALRDADLALRAAKGGGPNRVAVFRPELRSAQMYASRLSTGLRRALDRGELQVAYQPVVDLASGRPVAAEALLRWNPPGLTTSPAEFIPVAEETGMIGPIGAWVLRTACHDARSWYARHGVAIAVNVSARQFDDQGFADLVIDVLRDAGLPGSALILEITESSLVASTTAGGATSQLERIRGSGVRVAIDDFGTGYSSLSYLSHLPVDIVKIDRSFVQQGPGQAEKRWTFTRAVLRMVESMRLLAVAEGVETREQMVALRELRCPFAQGYLLGRPMPAEALGRTLARADEQPASPAFAAAAGRRSGSHHRAA